MDPIRHPNLMHLYRELQKYVDWQAEDERRVVSLGAYIAPHFERLIDDFYDEIQKHEATSRVLVGGQPQIARLKNTLLLWLRRLFEGNYDQAYVEARWRVGWRHVEINLDQVYASMALGRLRKGIVEAIPDDLPLELAERRRTIAALNKLLDIEGAIINAAYQAHSVERMRIQTEEQLKQSERLATIGKMITGLAHESRNLLQRSHACLETLKLDLGDLPDAMKQADRIQAALDRLQMLYEEVRNYAAPLSLDVSSLDIHKLILGTWHNLEPQWSSKDIRLECHCSGSTNSVMQVDRYRMEQVFTNLFQNAIEVSPEQSRITCHIEPDTSGSIVVTIEDPGSGIEDDVLPRVFEPFFTTKPTGTGLGLAITRRIIETHAGTIKAENRKEGGARFIIHLPQPELCTVTRPTD